MGARGRWLRRRGDGHSRADGGVPTRQGNSVGTHADAWGRASTQLRPTTVSTSVGGIAGRHRAGRTSGRHLPSPARNHTEPQRSYLGNAKERNSIAENGAALQRQSFAPSTKAPHRLMIRSYCIDLLRNSLAGEERRRFVASILSLPGADRRPDNSVTHSACYLN